MCAQIMKILPEMEIYLNSHSHKCWYLKQWKCDIRSINTVLKEWWDTCHRSVSAYRRARSKRMTWIMLREARYSTEWSGNIIFWCVYCHWIPTATTTTISLLCAYAPTYTHTRAHIQTPIVECKHACIHIYRHVYIRIYIRSYVWIHSQAFVLTCTRHWWSDKKV